MLYVNCLPLSLAAFAPFSFKKEQGDKTVSLSCAAYANGKLSMNKPLKKNTNIYHRHHRYIHIQLMSTQIENSK